MSTGQGVHEYDAGERDRHMIVVSEQIKDAHALAERCQTHLGMQITERELGDLKPLERDDHPTRYPDALVEGTPQGLTTKRTTFALSRRSMRHLHE